MDRFYVYRHGSNAANQPMDNGPVHVLTLKAHTREEARTIAAKRVSVYSNQFLTVENANECDAKEAVIDDQIEWSKD